MTTKFKDEWVERFFAECRAEGMAKAEALARAEVEAKGMAEMLLRFLTARGLQVPDEIREQVLACTDSSWALLGPDVTLRRTRYDAEAAARTIEASRYRGAQQWAAEYVLNHYSDTEALGAFTEIAREQD